MKLIPKYSSEVEHTLHILDTMICRRKDELDSLCGSQIINISVYSQDEKIFLLREERNRIESVAIPESYYWED